MGEYDKIMGGFEDVTRKFLETSDEGVLGS